MGTIPLWTSLAATGSKGLCCLLLEAEAERAIGCDDDGEGDG